TDRGAAQRDDAHGRLALLHNSIQADVPGGLAQAVAELAWAQMRGKPAGWRFLTLAAPVPVLPAPRDRVLLDEYGAIAALETADPHLPALARRGTAVYLGTEVWQGACKLGHAISELYADLAEGIARPIAGTVSQTIVMRADDVAA
ncbi:DUF7259 domain-containing protein, partial [Bordetella petrii]|uniref:DUF7259 domain-containing protein n=1 Tax=Bordetella petrii TaxID=94624 RepID=UPI003AF3EB2E|nr:hypothetical protein [Bordetella petrii]